MILCGRIAHYDTPPTANAPVGPFALILMRSLRVEGFNLRAHATRFDGALAKLRALADAGKLRQVDAVSHGLASAPAALCGLLQGRFFGKVVVEL